MIGQVTSEIIRSRSVVAETPPSTDQAYGECPCEYSHGWKWSEIVTKSKPAASARCACCTRSRGWWSSHISEKPKEVIQRHLPAMSGFLHLMAQKHDKDPK